MRCPYYPLGLRGGVIFPWEKEIEPVPKGTIEGGLVNSWVKEYPTWSFSRSGLVLLVRPSFPPLPSLLAVGGGDEVKGIEYLPSGVSVFLPSMFGFETLFVVLRLAESSSSS